ncbi:HAMP domain-containing sensor histidine kinase [Paraburkholderia sp. J12]|uniref:sensor histidine kinase n=1 Tax=Paraburkholderia sp. J12 TaxID=2805432 RepID=UPI002ABDDABC|nr:HAMP domain-containing sensor histidine kinase [Paraburkholderia sp. J12]
MSAASTITQSMTGVKHLLFWRVFVGEASEAAFQQHHLTMTRSSLRIALLAGPALFLAFSFSDFEILGFAPLTLFLLLVRLSFAWIAVCCFYALRRWPDSILTPRIVATIIAAGGMTIFMIITWSLPGQFLRHAMSMCALLMLMYFFVPNRFAISAAIALIASVVFVLIAVKQREIGRSDGPALMILVLINGFGLVVAARLEGHLREMFRNQVTMKHQAEALNQALRYSEDLNRQKVETIGYIGHDLRAPLSTISMYSKRLIHHAHDKQVPLIRAIERSVGYQLSLIEELLEYTKAELKPLDIKPVPTDISALLLDVAEFSSALCSRQDNEFRFQLQTTLPVLVECDGRRLQQVLLNLLSNAAKFTREGTVTLAVHLVPSVQGLGIGFEVSDTGIGIDLSQHADIFDAFRQVKETGGGTGLGLFIARSIVNAMGSELRVASTLGCGTTFYFELTVLVLKSETEPQPHVPGATAIVSDAVRIAEEKRVHMSRPPVADLDELAKLAKQGSLTDIEQWIARFSGTGQYPAFTSEVQECLLQLDFHGIVGLATTSEPRTTDH